MIGPLNDWDYGTVSRLFGAAPTAETTRAESSAPSITSLKGSGAGIMASSKHPLAAGPWQTRCGETVTLVPNGHGIFRTSDDRLAFNDAMWDGTAYSAFGGDSPDDLLRPYTGATYPAIDSRSAPFITKDSGAREEMPTGSVRDTREGKGRFDLISPFALRRLAGVYERGSKKYKDRNWEKGQTYSRCLDSALRHLNSFAMGWTDEDHLAQALWNVAAILHFQETGRTELDDMPHYQKGPTDA